MNSVACLNVILKQIQINVHSFENTNDLQKIVDVLFKLSSEVMQKSLSSSLLKNIIIVVRQLHETNIIRTDDYKLFVMEVNNFYKSRNLCENYKLAILSCFPPAIEQELLSLLKLCSSIKSTNELDKVKSAVESSLLVQVCQKNVVITQKVARILKKAFTLSEGNFVICYLTFCLCRSVEISFYIPFLLSKELNGLETFFQFPYQLVTFEAGELVIKHLIKLCFENERLKLCTKNDIIFYTTIYPLCFCKMLELCEQQTYIQDFLMFLCSDNNTKLLQLKNHINFARENHLWNFLCPEISTC